MTRRVIGTGVVCLLAGAALAMAASASDVDVEPQAAESEQPGSAGSEPEAAAGTDAGEGAPTPAPAAEGIEGWVERAAFTTAVVDREPQDALDSLTNDHLEVSFFTELREFQGQTVAHRWEYRGEVVAEVPFAVGASRWRTHSRKRLDPSWLGEWKVSVVDGSGRVLQSRSFDYRKATPAEPQQAAPAETEAPESPPAAPQP